jgi:hypothetical protein
MHRALGAAICFALVGCAGSAPKPTASETFHATLSPTTEVPAPTIGSATPAGTATFISDGTTVTYTVTATGLTGDYTMAHIHTGPAGVAGPVAVPLNLTAGTAPGTAGGQGSFDASAIKGKNADGSPMTMNDLLGAMRGGTTYINVHTTNNKPGEVRGQIGP